MKQSKKKSPKKTVTKQAPLNTTFTHQKQFPHLQNASPSPIHSAFISTAFRMQPKAKKPGMVQPVRTQRVAPDLTSPSRQDLEGTPSLTSHPPASLPAEAKTAGSASHENSAEFP